MNENRTKKKKSGILNRVMGGEIFTSRIFTDNVWLLALIVLYSFIYVSNRYAFHQELHIISNLKEDVKILKYDILTRQSELSGKGRQSNVEKYVKESESELGIATQPPFLIK